MNQFAQWIAAFLSSWHSAPLTGRQSLPNIPDTLSLSGMTWDEIFAAAMGDENSRTIVDHLGPRWK